MKQFIVESMERGVKEGNRNRFWTKPKPWRLKVRWTGSTRFRKTSRTSP